MSNLSDLLPAGAGAKSASFTASGTLSSGQTVALQSDGTVSAIVGITGAEVQFEAGESENIDSAFDPDTGKIVVAYTDRGDSNLGKAVVGTVSGNTISFGSETTFSGSSDGRKPKCIYDSNANKMVILYWDNANNKVYAIVGTVSGTSISFGTAHAFNNADTNYISGAFDPDTNKVIAVFADAGNSYYGTVIPLTVSGTSISGTTKTVFNSASSVYLASVYDTSADRLLIAYGNNGDSGHGYAIAGALSGSSYTFGSAVEFEGAQIEEANAVFDTTNNKTLVAYKDQGNSGAVTGCVISLSGSTVSVGTPVVISTNLAIDKIGLAYNPDTGKILVVWRGTNGYANEVQISGTSLTAGSDVQWMSGSTTSRYPSVSYDTSADKYAIFFSDFDDNTGNGFVYLGGPANTDFVGITDEAIADTATGSVVVQGGVSEKLSGLTVGADYYVQDDGSLASSGIPYDISGATYVQNFSVATQETLPEGLAFNTNGTKMFVVGTIGDDVNEYTLTTGFDVSTASFVDSFSVSAQQTEPTGVTFNSDGTKMFVVGQSPNIASEYALSVGFDVSTASHTQNYTITQDTNSKDIAFSSDGTSMFIVGSGNVKVYQYTLSSSFSLSSVSYTRDFSVSSQDSGPQGLTFSSSGLAMFVCGTSNDSVYKYNLTTAYNISTAAYDSTLSVSSQGTNPLAIQFNTSGEKFFILDAQVDAVNEYSTTPASTSVPAGRALSATKLLLNG